MKIRLSKSIFENVEGNEVEVDASTLIPSGYVVTTQDTITDRVQRAHASARTNLLNDADFVAEVLAAHAPTKEGDPDSRAQAEAARERKAREALEARLQAKTERERDLALLQAARKHKVKTEWVDKTPELLIKMHKDEFKYDDVQDAWITASGGTFDDYFSALRSSDTSSHLFDIERNKAIDFRTDNSAGGLKTYKKSEVLQLAKDNPEKYAKLRDEIMKASAEGRLID